MPVTLQYRVENSQIATIAKQIDIDGEPATAYLDRAIVECLPLSGDRTFTMDLPKDALAEFPEGATISVVVTVTALPPAVEAAEAA